MHRWTGVALGVAAVVLYALVGIPQGGTDSHWPFAQAFLQGRLHVDGPYPWLELVPRPGGGWYTPFPPLISLVMLPFAAVNLYVDTGAVAALFGGASVALVWMLLDRLGVARGPRVGLTIGWAVGSEVLWVAGTGGQHLAPQVASAALMLGTLVLAVDRRLPFWAGLLLGAAVAARVPAALALPLALWLYRPGQVAKRSSLRPWLLLLAGWAIPLAGLAWYNTVRFGSPVEFGYGLIRNVAGESVLD